jgi:hypothetical protein
MGWRAFADRGTVQQSIGIELDFLSQSLSVRILLLSLC